MQAKRGAAVVMTVASVSPRTMIFLTRTIYEDAFLCTKNTVEEHSSLLHQPLLAVMFVTEALMKSGDFTH